MQTFTYTNANNLSIVIGDDKDYKLQSADGLNDCDIVPYTITGYKQQGSFCSFNQLGNRVITLEFIIFGETDEEFYQKRIQAAKVFNPLIGEGTLLYDNGYVQRSIVVYPTSGLQEKKIYSSNLKAYAIDLTAYNPLWRDNQQNASKMLGWSDGLKYALKFQNNGVKFATMDDVCNIDITGDTTSPIRVVFHGYATNPKVLHVNSGKFIQVNTTVQSGQQLEICTDYGNKVANLISSTGVKTAANHLITNDSSFFELNQGDNQLSYTVDSGENVEVYVYWYNWYIGV